MAKVKILLLFMILGMTFFWLGSYCPAEEIPFGINNPYDYSAPKEKAFLIKPYMNDLGIKRVNENVFRRKVEPRPGVYDWREPDFFVRDILKDLETGFNIDPKTNWQVKGSVKVGKGSYIPGGDIDSESFRLYKTFLKELVKRYKDKVHKWEIFNEPSIEYKNIPEDYVKLLRISYLTIKEVDPQAIVGLGGDMPSLLSKKFLNNILPLLSSQHPVFGKDNAKNNNYFDSFDLHYFSFYNEYRFNRTKRKKIVTADEFLNIFKRHGLFEGKMITARAGATYTGEDLKTEYNGKRLEYQSEAQQASYLFRRAIYLLSRGVRSAWSQIREREKWQDSTNHFWCYQGLVYNGVPKGDKYDKGDGVKKLSYWTYKFLVEKIKETDWKNVSAIHDGTGSDHLCVYKLIKKNGQPLYIAWWDYFDEKKPGKTKTITIDVGNIESVKVTETIPNADWGKELKESNYPSFFKTEIKKVSNGKVSFDLGEKPVFVEVN
ncbi:MAG: hypothetical protein A2W05_00025 [Candidatus Schekmanbacteria bacterium RBG_16_38_10]|uniref:GH10 domain-containing protein n=1 Tax=Candidatus Schekmanbacteria bacterium RBG_16_38_10 TaxID=1817879 RepID=A0A1F7RTY4_9BACT|nr:MAG: hypothetical protein A2W05_00025 [Candidatus Schekmanbacteria bacterium RBG_16_38_10]